MGHLPIGSQLSSPFPDNKKNKLVLPLLHKKTSETPCSSHPEDYSSNVGDTNKEEEENDEEEEEEEDNEEEQEEEEEEDSDDEIKENVENDELDTL